MGITGQHFFPFQILDNVLNFSGHSFPIYEALSLNFSPFAYKEVIDAASIVSGVDAFQIGASLLDLISYFVAGFFIIFLILALPKLDEKKGFLFTVLVLLTLMPNAGGFVCCFIADC